MKSKLLSFIILAGLVTSSASATIIQLATTPINTQPGGNGDADIKTWVDATILSYNNAVNPDVPAAGLLSAKVIPGQAYAFGPTFDGTVKTITLNLTNLVGSYIVMGWGGSTYPNNTNGTTEYLYYIKDAITDSFGAINAVTFANAPFATGGLSAIHVYGGGTSVPDGGSTGILLGVALLGLALFARRSTRS